MPLPEVRLACARPAQVDPAACDALARMLDTDEHEALRRFKHEADRRAYIVAHSMLRALIAEECAIAPSRIELRHDLKGRPFVAQAPELHVSLSRSREAVACAVTFAAPVGVDIEMIDGRPADAGLLGAFVMTQEPVTTRGFYFQWTALEAFWKSCGTGLADGNARIACVARTPTRFDVWLERGTGPCARGAIVHAYEDCALSVVLLAPADPDFVLMRTDCASAVDIEQLSRAHAAHERFFAA
jgi:4'-phosphopantetheinyl transferase